MVRSPPHPGRPRKRLRIEFDHDFSIVTINARDFIKLLYVGGHPGLIVLRQSGLSRDEQWANLLPIIEQIKDRRRDSVAAAGFLG
jgi:hypothetical protein